MTATTFAGLLAEYLDQVNGSINLVFHDIVRAPGEQQGQYDVWLGSFAEIVDRCRRLGVGAHGFRFWR